MEAAAVDRNDLIIASAYGRGHWLAYQLAAQGWTVTLLDFTAALGEYSPKNYDGPFGLLETDLVSGSQKACWADELGKDSYLPIRGGYSLWLKQGPLEGHGPLSNFLSQENSVSLSVRNYLHMVSDLSDVRLKAERQQLAKLPFASTWLAGLMHQLHSNEFIENQRALEIEHTSPFFAPYSVREIKADSHQAALGFLGKKNVTVIRPTSLNSVLPESDELVRVQTDSKILDTRSFVMTLSSRETARVAPALMKLFYPSGGVEATWSWRRFDLGFSEQPVGAPTSFVLLQDPNLPWTHSNVLVLRSADSGWSCWAKFPVSRLKDPSYLSEQSFEIQSVLNQRLSWAGVKVSSAELAVPEWLIFGSDQKSELKVQFKKNIFASGPEHWTGVDPLSRMLAHREVLQGLESIRRVWDARQAKREEKELKRLNRQKDRDERKQQ